MTAPRIFSLLLCITLLSGCELPGDSHMQAEADSLSTCEKVERLLAGYHEHFDALKGPQLSRRYMDIWAAKVNAIGEDCQIWKSGSHSTYMCARNAPNPEIAREWLQQAEQSLGACLANWQREQSQRHDQPGFQGVVWSQPGKTAAVGVELVPTRGNQYTLYYFIGDRNKWF